MAKSVNSAIGVDLGYHTVKAVRLQKKGGGRLSFEGYSVREVGDRGIKPEEMQHHIKLLMQETGGKVKGNSVSVSGDEMVLRIIDQPPTPKDVMRSALKLNASMLLHQDCKDYVFDCDCLQPKALESGNGGNASVQYVVGGLPRPRVEEISDAFAKSHAPLDRMQVAPISLLNAFEYARPDEFSGKAFILLDVGHRKSTVVGGMDGKLVMVRNIAYGGKTLLDDLMMNGAIDREAAILLAEQGDAGMADSAAKSLQEISREMLSSIGFFEGQWDRAVDRVFVTGAATRAEMILQILSDDLNLPCEIWDPLDRCEIALEDARKESLDVDARNLNIAFGAALELVHGGGR